MQEIETKILEVDPKQIAARLTELGAEKILNTRLTVDWFRDPKTPAGTDTWFLRTRKRSDESAEVTWKSKSKAVGLTKQAHDLTFDIADAATLGEIFKAIGLVQYAHQEKDRTSWTLKQWRFDLDQYPGMPPYLEIEGQSEENIKEAIALLGLENHRAVPEGERILIEKEYHLDWHMMKF